MLVHTYWALWFRGLVAACSKGSTTSMYIFVFLMVLNVYYIILLTQGHFHIVFCTCYSFYTQRYSCRLFCGSVPCSCVKCHSPFGDLDQQPSGSERSRQPGVIAVPTHQRNHGSSDAEKGSEDWRPHPAAHLLHTSLLQVQSSPAIYNECMKFFVLSSYLK